MDLLERDLMQLFVAQLTENVFLDFEVLSSHDVVIKNLKIDYILGGFISTCGNWVRDENSYSRG